MSQKNQYHQVFTGWGTWYGFIEAYIFAPGAEIFHIDLSATDRDHDEKEKDGPKTAFECSVRSE